VPDSLESKTLQRLITENSIVLNDILNRAGKLPRTARVEFGCEMPDKASALAARQELMECLPPNNDRQIYVMTADGEVECRVDEIVNISSEVISRIELDIADICRKHGGGEVFWGFEGE